MSDLFDRLESFRQQPPRLDNPNRNQEYFRRAEEEPQKKKQEEAEVYSALNFNLNIDAYRFLQNQVGSGTIDEEEMFRLATSMNIADRYNLPVDYVRGNLPVFLASDGVNPNAKPDLTLFRSVINRGKIGFSAPKIGNMKYELMEASGPGGDKEHAEWLRGQAEWLRGQIERLEAKNERLEDSIPEEARTTKDNLNRTLKNLFGSGAQTLGYSLYVGAHALAGNAMGAALGGGGPVIGGLLAWDAGRKIEAGEEYWALTKIGIDHDIARPLSEAHGVISSGIEQVLETVLGLGAGALVKSVSKKPMGDVVGLLSSKIFKGMQQSGFLYKLIDADPQGNASAWVGPEEVSRELAGVLFEEYKAEAAIVKTATPGLWLLPSAGQGGNLKTFIERGAADNPFCMQALSDEAAGLGFKYMVVDLSPAFGTFERETVTAADEVVTPVTPEQFCIDGLRVFAENLADARKKMRSGKPLYNKLVVTALNKSFRRHMRIYQAIERTAGEMKVYVIPQDQIFGNVQVLRQTVQETGAAKVETLEAIRALAKDLSVLEGVA